MMAVSLAMLGGAVRGAARVEDGARSCAPRSRIAATVETLGHNVPRVFTMVFAAGTALAALAGVIGAPLFVIEPSMAESIGPIVFVVVVIGGLGSLGGALVASLLIGCVQTFAVASYVSLGSIAAMLRRCGAACVGCADASRRSRRCCRICCSSRCWRCARAGSSGARRRRCVAIAFAARRASVAAAPWPLVRCRRVPSSSQSWLLAYLAQTATMIVFALSYNLLLGETGLLSFGHAAYAGLGAFAAAHVFNRSACRWRCCRWSAGVGGALAGVLFGFISTRRAGTAFAMITLGIGELVAAGVWLVPGWFGGEGGVAIDRASGPPLFAWTLRPGARGLCADRGVVRARVRRDVRVLAHAVHAARQRGARQPRARRGDRLRSAPRALHDGRSWSAFFAGIAGVLGLINVELASAESVGLRARAAC